MTFYERFSALCDKKGVKPGRAAEDCGINRSNVNSWRDRGYTPRGDALQRIADYFGVTTDFLLGKETEKAPTPEGEREITYDDFTYAMYEETKDLPPEKKAMLLEMARFMRADMEKEK